MTFILSILAVSSFMAPDGQTKIKVDTNEYKEDISGCWEKENLREELFKKPTPRDQWRFICARYNKNTKEISYSFFGWVIYGTRGNNFRSANLKGGKELPAKFDYRIGRCYQDGCRNTASFIFPSDRESFEQLAKTGLEFRLFGNEPDGYPMDFPADKFAAVLAWADTMPK